MNKTFTDNHLCCTVLIKSGLELCVVSLPLLMGPFPMSVGSLSALCPLALPWSNQPEVSPGRVSFLNIQLFPSLCCVHRFW